MGVVNGISNAEGQLNADMAAVAPGDEAAKEEVTSKFVAKIQELMQDVTPQSMIIIGIWVVIILSLCFAVVWVLIHFGYKISEERHTEIVQELEKRHAEIGFNKEEVADEQAI